jgi:D-alanyl-D-alanine endopeptidase (penicillin-binding protein 7)
MRKIILSLIVLFLNQASANDILAKSWVIADADGVVLSEQNMTNIQPIASITKLMTAMVVLDSKQDLNQTFKMSKFGNTHLSRKQLLDLAIIHSDNQAADMLCKIYIRGYRGCIEDMNTKAEELGMKNTIYYDSTGLDNRNMSSAADLLKLLRAAENYPIITNASTQTYVGIPVSRVIVTKTRKNKKHQRVSYLSEKILHFRNTNPLVAKYNVLVSKTGYVRASGGCLAMSAIVDGAKRYYIILNSKTTQTRVHDMEKLIRNSSKI